MINLFSGLRDLLIGVVASASLVVSSVAPINAENKPFNSAQVPPEASNPAIVNQVNTTSAPVLTDTPAPSATPLALNGDNYIQVQGQYTVLFQTIKYLAQVPKKGGSFSGVANGICQAQIGGEYEGGNGGKISGKASGNCNFLGIKYQGTTDFTGRLYQDIKTMEIEIPNSPIKGPIKVNYN